MICGSCSLVGFALGSGPNPRISIQSQIVLSPRNAAGGRQPPRPTAANRRESLAWRRMR